MQAHKDFIVHIPKTYKTTAKTDSGFEYLLDKNFSGKDLANNIFEVLETPLTYEGEIKPGCNLLVDPVLVHNQVFQKFGEEENQYLVDRKRSLYRVDPSLIICYSMGDETEFYGFQDNLLCEKAQPENKEKEIEQIGSIFIPDMSKDKPQDTLPLKVIVLNDELKETGVERNDFIFHKQFTDVEINVRGHKFIWLKNRHVIGAKKEVA
jgi:co-chaperonin GroES (HSP10)